MVTVVRHKWEPVTTKVGMEPACAAGASAWRMPDRSNTRTAGGRGSTRARKKCIPT